MCRELTDRVERDDYQMRDLRGGTFTVSNLGPLGVDSFTPVINPPEVAILGVGRAAERAYTNDDGELVARTRLTLDLSFDHRVVDGADAARFVGTLAERVEDSAEWRGVVSRRVPHPTPSAVGLGRQCVTTAVVVSEQVRTPPLSVDGTGPYVRISGEPIGVVSGEISRRETGDGEKTARSFYAVRTTGAYLRSSDRS